MIKNYYFNQDSKETVLPSGLRRKILAYDENLMLVEVHFDQAGMEGSLHTHVHEQITYVVSGEFEFSIGDQKKVVKAGDSMYKQPNIIHGCVCIKPGMLLDVFTPKREDFL